MNARVSFGVRRGRLALCALTLAVASTAIPGHAATYYLTITGSKIAQIDVTLSRTIRFIEFDPLNKVRYFGVPKGGTFGGFLIERLPSLEWAAGGLFQRDILVAPDRRPLSNRFGPSQVTLMPGAYRIHLLTDAPMTIKLALLEGPSVSVSPTKASPFQIRRVPLVGTPTSSQTLTFTSRAGQQVSMATYSRTFGPTTRVLRLCVDDETPCPVPPGGITIGEPTASHAWMIGRNYGPSAPLAGTHTVRFEATHVGVVEATYGLLIVFPPGSHPKLCPGTVCGG